MTIRGDIENVIRGELDDVERAIKRDDKAKALRELDDAVRKLQDIANKVNHLEIEARRGR